MLKPWIETFSRRTPLTASALLSVVTHTLLIVAAILATSTAVRELPLPENTIVRFLAPPDRPGGQAPQPEMIRFVAISVPSVVVASASAVVPTESAPPQKEKQDVLDSPALREIPGIDSVFLVIDVDSAARRYEWSAAPTYPPRLLEQKISGFVRAQWVVQPDGYADTTTLRIVETTHDDFAQAVRDALPFMRFSPAKIGRRTVSQLVQQEFTFRIAVATADSQLTVGARGTTGGKPKP
jgi:Gram-negative bacterial TonB protein C-terminal